MQQGTRFDVLIDDHPIGRRQVAILLLCLGLTMFDGFATTALAISLPAISQSWNLPAGAFAYSLAATSAGSAFGALFIAPYGDRLGRKALMVASTFGFAIFTVSIPLAHDVTTLTFLRLLAGIGFGVFLPNSIALVEELAPHRRREFAVMVMISGLALGSIAGSITGSVAIPRFGWGSIYYIGGVGALVLACIAAFALPESIAFLIARGKDQQSIRSAMLKLFPESKFGTDDRLIARLPSAHSKLGVSLLFSHGRAAATVMFWFAIVLQYFSMFLFILWLPTLLRKMGVSLPLTLQITALMNVGSFLGTILISSISRIAGPYRTLAVVMLLGGSSCALFSLPISLPLLAFASFAAGFFLFGGFTAIAALVSEFYPVEIKATGLGWATGLARLAAMTSPLIVAAMIDRGATGPQVLLVPVVMLPAAALLVAGIASRSKTAKSDSEAFITAQMTTSSPIEIR